MRPKRSTSISKLAMVVTLGVSSAILVSESDWQRVQAQDAATTIRINNLTRMAPINQTLKQGYETQTPGATVEIKRQQADAPLQVEGQQADLAAISRLLTEEEKGQGLVQVPVTREKIAIVVGQDNPFAKGLTIDQVVKIFRGEITNWSQLGGPSAPIRVIHRPIASNLQSTLQTYELFRAANFEAGGQIVQLDQDNVAALMDELGKDGISYALASQIGEAEAIRPISMYDTLPDDPRYPFSQPFTYVYEGTPTASTKTFLDFVASAPGQAAIVEAKTQSAIDDTSANGSSTNDSAQDGKTDTNAGSVDNAQSDNAQSANTSSASSDGSSASNPDGTGSSTVASTDTAGEAQDTSGGLGWLPIALVTLVLGGLVGGVLKTLLAKSKPKPAPRPAPNYAEKIRPTRIQAPETELQELPSSSPSVPVGEAGSSPLSPENVVLGAAAASAVNEMATPSETKLQGSETELQVSEMEPQVPDERVDITSRDLQAKTRIQTPKTELQDTPPSQRGPKTQIQDPTATQLQVPDSEDLAASAALNLDSSPTQLYDPTTTQLQDPSNTQLQEPHPTQLQDSSPTQLQDLSATQLQEPNPTQLQDPSSTQLQDSSPTQLQDPSATQLQDPHPTQLQDSSPTQLQEPQQAWMEDVDNPFGIDSPPTQLQDPRQTWIQDEELSPTMEADTPQTPDPRQTWIQDEDFPEGMEPQISQTLDPKQTWIQDEDEG
ncbi:substrate-binding domain-containing protein [Acaryochloris marina NIES-2412]|uniref:substrate-binding domain-containing protein n=1 Tax=Acaryochloris marina TaxID=155978 RepID=UPI0040596F8E